MKLGLLGIDARIAAVAAAAGRAGDRVVVVCGLHPAALVPPGLSAAGGAVRESDTAALLDAAVCDAVLVSADDWDVARADTVRLLVQAGRTLLLAHPLEPRMLWAYELDMIRRDSGARLVPLLTDRLHPYVARLRRGIEVAAAGASPLGDLESVGLERTMHDRSQAAVLTAFARDADLVRVLVGEPERLATLGAGEPAAAWPSLAVGLSGAGRVPVRWQVAAGATTGLTITLRHAAGSVTVFAPDDPAAPWLWRGPPEESLAFDAAAAAVDLLHRAAAPAPPPDDDTVAPADWADAARAIELAETVPRSLARGRAVDLHREEFSELGTFRGTMASLGCGLVLAALLVLLAATLLGGLAHEFEWELGLRIAAAWPVFVLVVLGAFLLLQVLPLIVGPAPDRVDEPPRQPPTPGDGLGR